MGDDPPRAQEVDEVGRRREERSVARARNERARLRAVAETEADPARRVQHVRGGAPPFAPSFDEYLNDAWTVRKEVTEAFRRGAHMLIVRNRVRRRLAAIRHKLALVGGASANAVEAILSAESAPAPAQQGGARGKTGGGGLSRMEARKVVSYTFPLHRDGNFRDRSAVKVCAAEPMEDWDYLELRVPQTAALLQYKEQERPAPRPAPGARRPTRGQGACAGAA